MLPTVPPRGGAWSPAVTVGAFPEGRGSRLVSESCREFVELSSLLKGPEVYMDHD